MSTYQSENKTHNATVQVAEGTRQFATAGASAATTKTAEITFYRAALASAIANSVGTTPFVFALKELGTGGT